MRGRILTTLVILVAISITVFAVQAHNRKVRHQIEAAGTVNECVSELLLVAKVSGPIREEFASRYDAIAESVRLFVDARRDEDNPFADSALQLCTDISNVIIDNERHILTVINTAQSIRMSDSATLKDEAEYQWRISTIQQLAEVVDFIGNYDAVLIDNVRATMVASDLPRESKVAIYSHIKSLPINQSRSQRQTVYLVRELLALEQNIIELLYKGRDKYQVRDVGDIVFNDDGLRTQVSSLTDIARQSRAKLDRLGNAAFFGQKPLIAPPIS